MKHVTLPLLLAACGPASVGGRVDGERVGGARDAFYDRLSLDFGPFGELEYLVVMLTDFDEGCAVFEEFFDIVEFSCDDLCDDYVAVADEYRLDDRQWSLAFVVNTSDGVDGAFDLDGRLGDGEFTASFSSWDTGPLRDPGTCEAACEDEDLLDSDVDTGEDGTLELEQDGDRLGGRFALDLGGEDRLEGSFTATECDMADWLFFR
jgi:hypothetical protein